jgi:hypothetical protein
MGEVDFCLVEERLKDERELQASVSNHHISLSMCIFAFVFLCNFRAAQSLYVLSRTCSYATTHLI